MDERQQLIPDGGQGVQRRLDAYPARVAGAVGLGLQQPLDPLLQDTLVLQVAKPQAHPPRPVRVGWPDAPARGAHEILTSVHVFVVRQHQMRPVRDAQLGMQASGGQIGPLLHELHGVDHHAVAQNADGSGVQHAAGQQVELEGLAPCGDRMPGVGPALVAHHVFGSRSQKIGDLALALVSPLRPDDCDSRHVKYILVKL